MQEEHTHPDLLDDQIDGSSGSRVDGYEAPKRCCIHCRAVRHLVWLDEGFGFWYCHWCGNYQ